MKKFIELFKAWRRGETIEAKIEIPASLFFAIIGVIVLLIWFGLRYALS